MGIVWIVFKKELKNAFRDRRTLFSTIIFPIVILPLIVILPSLLMVRKEEKIEAERSKIVIIGAEKFEELAKAIKESEKFKILKIDDPKKAVKGEEVDCVIEIKTPPEGDEPASVVVYLNTTRDESRGAADKLKLVINQFSNRLVALRLKKFNLDPKILTPIVLEDCDVATKQERGGFFAGSMIGMFVLIGLMSGGMTLALDATAGEKERKTLEVLLASPASRKNLIMGKFLGTIVMGIIAMILMALGFGLSFFFWLPMVVKEMSSAIGIAFSTQPLIHLIIPLLLTAAFISALEIVVGIFARSFREGQSYYSPIMIIIIVPMVLMHLIPPHPSANLFYIPLFNTMLLIRELLMGVINQTHISNTILSSLIYTFIALRFTFWMFKREKVILRY